MLGHYKFNEDLKIGDLVSVVHQTPDESVVERITSMPNKEQFGTVEKLKLYNRLSAYNVMETNGAGETIIIDTFSPSIGTLYELGMFQGEIRVGKNTYSRKDLTYFVRASVATKDIIEPIWFLPLGDAPELDNTFGGSIVSDNSNNIYVLASIPKLIKLRDRRQVGDKKSDKIAVFYMHIQFINDSPFIVSMTGIDSISERDNLNIVLDGDTTSNLFISGMLKEGRKSYIANILMNGNIQWDLTVGASDVGNSRSIISSIIAPSGNHIYIGGLYGMTTSEDQIVTGPLYLVLNKTDGSEVLYETGIFKSSRDVPALSAITSMAVSTSGEYLYLASITAPGKIRFMDNKFQVQQTSVVLYKISIDSFRLLKYKKYPINNDNFRLIAPEIVSTPVNGTTLHIAFYNSLHSLSLYHLNGDMTLLNQVQIDGLSTGISSSIISSNKYQLFINGFNSSETDNTRIDVISNENINIGLNRGITMMFVPDLPAVIGVVKSICPRGMKNETVATVVFQGQVDGIFSALREHTQYYIAMDGRYTTKSFNRSPILLTFQNGDGIFFGIRTARLQ